MSDRGAPQRRRVAMCLTGALKMNPDAAPAMAMHILSHTIMPWRADVFVVIEIGNTLIESRALRDYAVTTGARSVQVLCAIPGCHEDVQTWCHLPNCTAQPVLASRTKCFTLKVAATAINR